jgi:hypothetical protein
MVLMVLLALSVVALAHFVLFFFFIGTQQFQYDI